MTSLGLSGLRRLATALLAIVLVLAGPSMARAADDNKPAAAPAESAAGAGDPAAGDKPAAAKPEAASLQIQDEGPGADSDRDRDRLRLSRARIATSDEAEERPLWKNWIFWTVTGVLVAGAIGMLVYTSSGKDSNLAPCPVDIAVSLGCFGAGRQ